MPVPPAVVEVLRDLIAVVPRWGSWYLFGAQAVVAYGVPRLSADVDITLRLRPDAPDRFVKDMREAGFDLRVDDPDFVRRTRVLPFVHLATHMPVDVVLAGSGLEDEFLGRVHILEVEGLKVPTIDPEDLVIAKLLAGRPKDIDDARGLWRAHGEEMDESRMASVLRQLEEALGQGDLLPAFDALRRRRGPS